jgi:hypothetical protein
MGAPSNTQVSPVALSLEQIVSLGASDYGWHTVVAPDPRYTFGFATFTNAFGGSYQQQGMSWNLKPGAMLPLGWAPVPPTLATFLRGGQPQMQALFNPAWFDGKGGVAGWTFISPGFSTTNTAAPVAVRKLKLPDGSFAWHVPGSWELNEGWQALTPGTAKTLLGLPLSGGKTTISNGAPIDPRGYLFAYDPSMFIPTGMESGVYKPGENVGRENFQALGRAALFAGAVAGAGLAAGAFSAAGGGIAPGATAVSSGATGGIEAEGIAQGAIVTAAPAVETPAGVALEGTAGLYDVAPGAEAVTSGATGGIGGTTISQGGILSSLGIEAPTTGTLVKAGATTLLGKLQGLLSPKRPPVAHAIPATYTPQPNFTSTATGQITIAVVGGLIVILLAKAIL